MTNAADITVSGGAHVWGVTQRDILQLRRNTGSLTLDTGQLPLDGPLVTTGRITVVNGGVLHAEQGLTQEPAPAGAPPPAIAIRGSYPGAQVSQIAVGTGGLTLTAGTLAGDGLVWGPGGITNTGDVVIPDPTLSIDESGYTRPTPARSPSRSPTQRTPRR